MWRVEETVGAGVVQLFGLDEQRSGQELLRMTWHDFVHICPILLIICFCCTLEVNLGWGYTTGYLLLPVIRQTCLVLSCHISPAAFTCDRAVCLQCGCQTWHLLFDCLCAMTPSPAWERRANVLRHTLAASFLAAFTKLDNILFLLQGQHSTQQTANFQVRDSQLWLLALVCLPRVSV